VTAGSDRALSIYLNDHYGGAAAAVARCRHARHRTSDEELARFLDELRHQIEQDRETLTTVMARLGIEPSTLKPLVGLALERLARLKPSGRLSAGSRLPRLVDLEALSLGVEGKRLLWGLLAALEDPRLAEFDFASLVQRAVEQRDEIEAQRVRVGRGALAES
jgi:hypothetical protein